MIAENENDVFPTVATRKNLIDKSREKIRNFQILCGKIKK